MGHALSSTDTPAVVDRDRRCAERIPGTALPPGLHARLRAGREVVVVNLSRSGILLESTSRLLPGHRCTLRITGPQGQTAVHGRVLRAEVTRLDRQHGVIYRGAIIVDDARSLIGVASTHRGSSYTR